MEPNEQPFEIGVLIDDSEAQFGGYSFRVKPCLKVCINSVPIQQHQPFLVLSLPATLHQGAMGLPNNSHSVSPTALCAGQAEVSAVYVT